MLRRLRVGEMEGQALELSQLLALRDLRVWEVEGRALELSL